MTRNPRGYNGLALPGGIQAQPSREQQVSAAIQAMAREIYARAAADLLASDAGPDVFLHMAQQAQAAGLAYFESLGWIERRNPDEPPPPADAAL